MLTTLYRPVNIVELELIQQDDWQGFPPRLPEQPIFYPVTNADYARQITLEWNLPSYKNGFVTAFDLSTEFLKQYKIEKVGLDHHTELWVPAKELANFNANIQGPIRVTEGYHADPNVYYFFVDEKFVMGNESCRLLGRFLDPKLNIDYSKLVSINDFELLPADAPVPVRKLDKDGNPLPDYLSLEMKNLSEYEAIERQRVYEVRVG